MAPGFTAAPTGRCAQPGCTGTIQDGYCDLCGMAGTPAAAVPAGPPAGSGGRVPRPRTARDGRCAQPGCTGTIRDGYCDVCGMAGPPAAPVPAGSGSGRDSRTGGARAGSAGGASGRTGGRTAGTGGTAGSGGTAGTAGSGGTSPSRSTRSRSSRRRGMLGLGLIEVPRVPYRDPATAILADPMVAENRRFCGSCGEPVGRSRAGRPGRTEGFCAACGAAYSFTPKLAAGDLAGGQYEVLGCLAHGGLGWIYLARDRNVSDRWVVLKGLLDTGDADALAAAAAERAFLAEVEHPNIVKIYNFVQHAGSGYIVMEYVGGRPLKDILRQRRDEDGPDTALPLAQVIAYGIEVLRAFDYLHGLGVLYCDFKPDNAIQSEEQLKLIDLGGVRRIDDADGPIYGTVGYQAPEIAELGPSVSSDLYTVGRTLAVLSFPFKGYTTTYKDALPPREQVPVLAAHESYDRLLRRACHRDPARRFQDAAEMAEQLTGVLREVLAAGDGAPRPAPSALFGPERFAGGTGPAAAPREQVVTPLRAPTSAEAAATLPLPLVDTADPAAGYLAGLTALEPERLAAALAAAPSRSPEVELMEARVRIELGDVARAGALLDGLARDDWRVAWYRAVAALAGGRAETASGAFDGLYGLMPGEAAPKLALALCRELLGDPAGAARRYEAVWRTDHGFVGAAFGLARVRLATGDRGGALAVLDSVPATSSHHVTAQIAAVTAAVRGRDPGELTEAGRTAAGARLEALRLDAERDGRLAVELLTAALGWVRSGRPGGTPGRRPRGTLLGAPLTEGGLRRALERRYRGLARLAGSRAERHALVGQANAVRPLTVV